jgi:ribosomal protein S18 acetylase RimI-like enzyme
MTNHITVKETPIAEAVKVNQTITEFDAPYDQAYFETRYGQREHLIIVGYVDGQPAGYIVGYDRDQDGSFYCWMAGVDPAFRRRGVLSALMNYQCAWAKQHGYAKLKIKTRNNRREMLSYLVKNGFMFTNVAPAPNIQDNRLTLEKPL